MNTAEIESKQAGRDRGETDIRQVIADEDSDQESVGIVLVSLERLCAPVALLDERFDLVGGGENMAVSEDEKNPESPINRTIASTPTAVNCPSVIERPNASIARIGSDPTSKNDCERRADTLF